MQMPPPPTKVVGLPIRSTPKTERIAGRGDHGVVPPSCVSPTVSFSRTPYHTDGASEIGSPAASAETLTLSVEPAIENLVLAEHQRSGRGGRGRVWRRVRRRLVVGGRVLRERGAGRRDRGGREEQRLLQSNHWMTVGRLKTSTQLSLARAG